MSLLIGINWVFSVALPVIHPFGVLYGYNILAHLVYLRVIFYLNIFMIMITACFQLIGYVKPPKQREQNAAESIVYESGFETSMSYETTTQTNAESRRGTEIANNDIEFRSLKNETKHLILVILITVVFAVTRIPYEYAVVSSIFLEEGLNLYVLNMLDCLSVSSSAFNGFVVFYLVLDYHKKFELIA